MKSKHRMGNNLFDCAETTQYYFIKLGEVILLWIFGDLISSVNVAHAAFEYKAVLSDYVIPTLEAIAKLVAIFVGGIAIAKFLKEKK